MQLEIIVKGMRPKTLIAGIVPPITAYALYYSENGLQGLIYLILCVFLALFIQIATNYYNDAIDHLKGADENRVGPERISTQDKIDYKKVFWLGHLFIVLAFLVGVPLVLKGGPILLVLGLLSLFLAYGYTGGPYPLAYLGLGELFVFLFFGLVATIGSYYIFAGTVSLSVGILAAQLGLLSSVLIAVNNFRDRDQDVLVGKKTLATRLSRYHYLLLVDGLLFIPYFLILYFILFVDLRYFFALFSVSMAYKVRKELHDCVDLKYLNTVLALSGKHLFVFSLLMTVVSLWR